MIPTWSASLLRIQLVPRGGWSNMSPVEAIFVPFPLKTGTKLLHPLPHSTIERVAGEICGASREAQNIKRMRGCVLLILLSLDAPGMSSNHRGRRPGARRSEDARRQSTGVRRSFFAYNSSPSPAEDVLGLVPLTGDRRAVLPSMHGRSFTAPLTREALLAERRAATALTSRTTMQIMA